MGSFGGSLINQSQCKDCQKELTKEDAEKCKKYKLSNLCGDCLGKTIVKYCSELAIKDNKLTDVLKRSTGFK